ncbi:MAG: TIGR03960 family B12-binding radical SAM protein [Anaerolineaceae bacterium]
MLLTPLEICNRLDEVLLTVQKPGRYVGGELNQVLKDWNAVQTHVALVFPDIYDIGLPNLGLAILYDLLNQRSDVWAERAYCPWIDMEAAMRRVGIPAYSLESKHPLAQFDIIALTLPYETLYTNALNLLDLAEVPLFSSERRAEHPLVIAGGHATFNPEPMSAFIDAFVIGEGEEVIHEIVDAYQNWKKRGSRRSALLQALAAIAGVYVPSLYEPHYHPDGTLASMQKLETCAALPVTKRIVAKLPPPPTRLIVPSVDVVHNRIAIEIMRGCTRGCRFCHAGMVVRPVRERSVEEIVNALEAALDHTGFEEIALLSLSSSDYTNILDLVKAVSQRFQGQRLAISLPSLRIESFSIDLMDHLKDARHGGFTLAPEAATERMRNIINKPISSQALLDTTREIYRRGWLTIKLYFMIGHPSETIDDVQAIADLCKTVIAEGRRIAGNKVNLHAGVSTFVPKPHTPFQWAPCDTLAQIEAKQQLLKRQLRGPGLKLNWTDGKETMLEAWLSRGDRRMSAVIHRAFRKGATFDAWQDKQNYQLWLEAFSEVGLEPEFYTHRNRYIDEVFPWDHISAAVKKSFLAQDYQWSQQNKLRIDCREQCFACGILPHFAQLRRENPGDGWKCPEVSRGRVRAVRMVEEPV